MDIITRWLSILGIGTVCFATFLFVVRVPIRTIMIFFAIGILVVILWFYADEKSKKQRLFANIVSRQCVCPICKHEEAKNCLELHCACCLVLKGGSIIDHSVNTEGNA